jgi:hypothetical protein
MIDMNRTIKTKNTVISVKTVDHGKNLTHYMKQSSVRAKQSSFQSKENSNQQDKELSPQGAAIDDIRTVWKKSV